MKIKTAGLFVMITSVLVLCSCAPVTLESIPDGAEVYDMSGTKLGTTAYKFNIIASDKAFVLKKDGYCPQPVIVPFDAPSRVYAGMIPETILVTSEPSGAKISTGIKSYGITPNRIQIFDENRAFTFKADGFFDKEVIIGPDSPRPLHVVMERRPIVTITSAGADIFENGAKIGTDTATVEVNKERTFEFRKDGFFAEKRTIKGAPPYQVNVDLKAFPVITVDSVPAAAKVFRSNAQIGTAPVQLAVGEAIDVELRADRYYSQTVKLTPSSSAKTTVTLKPMPYVTVNVSLAGAQVFVDGKSLGTAPVELLVEKPVTAEIRKDGYISKTVVIDGKSNNINVTLEPVPPPVEEKKEEPVVAAPVIEEPAPAVVEEVVVVEEPAAEKSGKGLMWGLIAAAVVLGGIILLAAKKKKKKQ